MAREVIARLGKASGVLSEAERRYEMPLACEAIKETMLRAAQQLVDDAGGRPIATSKSCDGTPLTIRHRSSLVQPGGKRVRISGKECQEILVANQFIRCDMGAGEGSRTRVLLAEPTPLIHGKSVPAILLACRQHWRRLRQLGHFGCAVEHYCWDRAGITALEQQTRQWHAQQPLPEVPPGMDPEIVRLSEFVCVTACALHDAHNALKWSMAGPFSDKDLVRDSFIAFESLRRSTDILSDNIHQWIGRHLHAHPDKGRRLGECAHDLLVGSWRRPINCRAARSTAAIRLGR